MEASVRGSAVKRPLQPGGSSTVGPSSRLVHCQTIVHPGPSGERVSGWFAYNATPKARSKRPTISPRVCEFISASDRFRPTHRRSWVFSACRSTRPLMPRRRSFCGLATRAPSRLPRCCSSCCWRPRRSVRSSSSNTAVRFQILSLHCVTMPMPFLDLPQRYDVIAFSWPFTAVRPQCLEDHFTVVRHRLFNLPLPFRCLQVGRRRTLLRMPRHSTRSDDTWSSTFTAFPLCPHCLSHVFSLPLLNFICLSLVASLPFAMLLAFPCAPTAFSPVQLLHFPVSPLPPPAWSGGKVRFSTTKEITCGQIRKG